MKHCSWLGVVMLLTVCRGAHGAGAPATAPDRVAIEEMKRRAQSQLRATRPDYVVFAPQIEEGAISQTGNEHFLVFDGPDGSLMAVWTQSTQEGQPDQHIVFARSADEGVTWSAPRIIAGPAHAGEGAMASWGFPIVSRRGRIYVLYSGHVGKFDTFFHTTGQMAGICSDDGGKTWSEPRVISMPRSSRDNRDLSYPANWIVWQKPLRLTTDGRYLAGFTRWTSKDVMRNPGKSWTSHDSSVEFMRFENIDDDPPVSGIKITFLAGDDRALRVPHPVYKDVSICQEPAIVKLPDGRLFCVMRTMTGSPYWSIGTADGEKWSAPRQLLFRDGGGAVLHPLSPCPIFDLSGAAAGSGSYVMFIHNNDGNYNGAKPEQTGLNRRPVFLLHGRFNAQAEQPVWFDEPRLFMDHDGTALGAPGTKGRLDLAMYSSMTVRNGRVVFWYPDRKFFLLGRKIELAGGIRD